MRPPPGFRVVSILLGLILWQAICVEPTSGRMPPTLSPDEPSRGPGFFGQADDAPMHGVDRTILEYSRRIEENTSQISFSQRELQRARSELVRERELLLEVAEMMAVSEAQAEKNLFDFFQSMADKMSMLVYENRLEKQMIHDMQNGQPDVFYYERMAKDEADKKEQTLYEYLHRRYLEATTRIMRLEFEERELTLENIRINRALATLFFRTGNYSQSLLFAGASYSQHDPLQVRFDKRPLKGTAGLLRAEMLDSVLLMAMSANRLGRTNQADRYLLLVRDQQPKVKKANIGRDFARSVLRTYESYLVSEAKAADSGKTIGPFSDQTKRIRGLASLYCKAPEGPETRIRPGGMAPMGRFQAQEEPLGLMFRPATRVRFDANDERRELDNFLGTRVITILDMIGEGDAADKLYASLENLAPDHPDFAMLSRYAARSAARDGNVDRAIELQEEASQSMVSFVTRILPNLDDEQQISYVRDGHRDFLATSTSLALGLSGVDNEVADRSAEWIMNGKAVVSEANFARELALREIDKNIEMREKSERLQAIREEFARRAVDASTPPKSWASLLQERSDLISELKPARSRSGREDPWYSLEELRERLPENSVFVDIVRAEVHPLEKRPGVPQSRSSYVAWIVPSDAEDKVRCIELGPASEIDNAIGRFRERVAMSSAWDSEKIEQLVDRDDSIHKESVDPLSRLLLGKIRPSIDRYRRWIISPDSQLWLVPFAALTTKPGRYVVEDHDVACILSARDLVDNEVEGRVEGNAPVLVVNPTFDALVFRRRNLALDELVGTEREANACEKILEDRFGRRPVVLKREGATEKAVKSLKRPSILLIATHCVSIGSTTALKHPFLRSGLVLAGPALDQREARSGNEGLLTPLEILALDLQGTDLVILSSCDTGLGEIADFEGVIGHRQAFQAAGARAVVATLWKVRDGDAAEFVPSFLRRHGSKTDQGERVSDSWALCEAQRAAIASLRGRYECAPPSIWAAYTLTGRGVD